jgi:hypothetical protein
MRRPPGRQRLLNSTKYVTKARLIHRSPAIPLELNPNKFMFADFWREKDQIIARRNVRPKTTSTNSQ